MDHAVRMAIENAMEDDVTFRQGLPLNYRNFLGTQKDMSKYVEDDKEEKMSNEKDNEVMKFKERIKDYLSKLVDHIDVNKAADAMSSDFIGSRLPPFGHAPPEGIIFLEVEILSYLRFVSIAWFLPLELLQLSISRVTNRLD